MAIVGVLAALAGCAQQQAPAVTAVSDSGEYGRPRSYSPPGPPGDPWGPWIRQASRRFDVPERWIREVMRQESGGRAGATSPVGAMGLMQVMPGTYRELRGRYGLGDDPYHPYDSIMAGTAYIREMYELYGSPAFLAAYNAGPRRLEDYLWNSRGLPAETRNYVARIGPGIVNHSPNRRAAPEVYAAAEIPLSIPAGPRRMDGATMLALREQRQATDPGVRPTVLAGPVRRMDPIPDGSTGSALAGSAVPAPYRVAAIGPVVRMDPIPDGSTYAAAPAPTRMDPIPDGSTPEGAARLAEVAGRAEAREAAREAALRDLVATTETPRASGFTGLGVGSALAASALPAPAPSGRAGLGWGRGSVLPAAPAMPQQASVPAGGRGATQLASLGVPPLRLPASAARPAAPTPAAARSRFGVLGTAQAAPAGTLRLPAPPAGRTVQVGAFRSPATARDVATQAAAGRGRAVVEPVATRNGTLYRAQVAPAPAPRPAAARPRGR